ncbi:MAG TPA: DNA polymerase [Candidatus Dormibacteraeota bacterium]|jgi:DNA polymerase-4|nr:DNA polymerase [Candidatus Dormibacteraeota bacterium]
MPASLPAFSEGQYPTVGWLFLDLNSYFASIEQQDRPELRGRPVGVVAVDTDSTCCLAASYEAKAYGVRTGTLVKDAKALCPHINLVVARPKLYVEYQQKIIQAMEEHLPVYKAFSVDEMACQLMGRERFLPNATTLGYRIKQSLRNLGVALRCSIGLAPNCYLAKTAADLCKPDGLTILLRKDLPQALHCMKLRDVVGISYAMEHRLHNRGITTVERLCKLSSQQMRDIWGSVQGETMSYWLHGEDWKEKAAPLRKSIGKQHVLAPKYRTKEQAYLVGLKLLSNAAIKLRRLNMWARGIGVTIAFRHWGHETKDETEPSGWKAHRNIHACRDTITLQEHFRELWKQCPTNPPVHVGVWLFDLIPDKFHTLGFFDDEKRETVSSIMDKINQKYGQHTVYLGGLHGLGDAAPTRIPFFSVPELADF